MILVKEMFVLQKHFDDEIWKEALFTKEEAELEILIAEKENQGVYKIIPLEQYLSDLIYSYY
jgi:hypothetical protein